MLKLEDGLLELIRKVATSLPRDVQDALQRAYENESPSSPSKEALGHMIENAKLAKMHGTPLCQDTGTPIFYAKVPKELGFEMVNQAIMNAVRKATKEVPLRANAVDTITEKNTGDNTGYGMPEVNFEQSEENSLVLDLSLKGAGSENCGAFYKLPYERLNAERDFNGVRKCVLDAVHAAQGKACPPYTIGVGIAGTRLMAAKLSRQALMRKLTDESPEEALRGLEKELLSEINQLGIGALGLGGESTALGVKIMNAHRHIASYFVDISFSCWANRRGRLIW